VGDEIVKRPFSIEAGEVTEIRLDSE